MRCNINNNSNFDTTEIENLLQDLFSFSQQRHGFRKPVTLNLVSDESNSSPLGKTAHYDPSSMEIVIYVDGRHPKDIMRSFSHELVHHNQNENGMFDNITGHSGNGYAQSNPHLRKMEKEAYLQGNMCFRDWEDRYKSTNPNILNERRTYKMSTKDWKNKELNGLLNERWGFSMDLDKLNEGHCMGAKKDDEKEIKEEGKCPECEEECKCDDDCPKCKDGCQCNEQKEAINEEDDSDGKYSDNDGKKEKCDYVDCGNKEEIKEEEEKDKKSNLSMLELMAAIGQIDEDDIAAARQALQKREKELKK